MTNTTKNIELKSRMGKAIKSVMVMATVITAIAATPVTPVYANSTDVKVNINGKPLVTDTQAVIINNSTMVPMRAIFETLDPNAKIYWDGNTKEIVAYFGENADELWMKVDLAEVDFNGTTNKIPTSPKIINSRTMVPLRVVSEYMGAKVEWVGATRTVNITATIPEKYVAPTPTAEVKPTKETLVIDKEINLHALVAVGYTKAEAIKIMEDETLKYINERRVANNLRPFIYDARLQKAAQLHSQDMTTNNYFEHVNLKNERAWKRAQDQGWETTSVGENISHKLGSTTPKDIYTAWFNSEGHKNTMMAESQQYYAGIGIDYDMKDGRVNNVKVTLVVGGKGEDLRELPVGYLNNMIE